MKKVELGSIEQIDVREIWEKEDADFNHKKFLNSIKSTNFANLKNKERNDLKNT